MKLDTALPGRHTCSLYNSLKKTETSTFVQLRTGIIQLNGYLQRIGNVESDQYACGQAKETGEYFLFRCTLWTQYRERLLQQTETRRGSLSFYLAGKAPSDGAQWKPNISAVRATVQYAIATGRLKPETEQGFSAPSSN